MWKDIVEYVLAFINIFAWPAVSLIIFFAMKPHLVILAAHIKEIRFGAFSVTIADQMLKAVNEVRLRYSEELPPMEEIPTEIIDSDPRIAIIKSWAFVAAAIEDLVEAGAGGKAYSNRMSTHQRIEFLREANVIDGPLAGILHDMRAIRNTVAHAAEDVLIHEDIVQEFLKATSRIALIVEELGNKSQPDRP